MQLMPKRNTISAETINDYGRELITYKLAPKPFKKKEFIVTGNLPVGFNLPVITFTAERCISSLIW